MCIVICTLLLSRPARGAWVEIISYVPAVNGRLSRPARGAWVEMFFGFGTFGNFVRRAPQGARGLKFCVGAPAPSVTGSRPARGAWVEIIMDWFGDTFFIVAPRKGRVG